jgi:hypothetical protein
MPLLPRRHLHLLGAPASSGRRPPRLSLSRGLPKGCVGEENHRRCIPSCYGVSGSLSKAVYFRISAGTGVPGVIVGAVRVWVHGRCRLCDTGVVAPRSPSTLRSVSSSSSSMLVRERNPCVRSTRVRVRTPTVTALLIDRSLGVFEVA